MRNRIIIELDKHIADKFYKKYMGKVVPMGEFGNGKIIEIYTPIGILPKNIEKIRQAVKELAEKGITNDLIKSHLTYKYGVTRGEYDMVTQGLADIIGNLEKERKINKLKE